MKFGLTKDQQYDRWRARYNAKQRSRLRFAIIPTQMGDGRWIWLEWYRVKGWHVVDRYPVTLDEWNRYWKNEGRGEV